MKSITQLSITRYFALRDRSVTAFVSLRGQKCIWRSLAYVLPASRDAQTLTFILRINYQGLCHFNNGRMLNENCLKRYAQTFPFLV